MGRELRREELRRRSDRYIRELSTPDGCTVRSARDISEGFRKHFQDHFTAKADLCKQEFCNYLVGFPQLEAFASASCDGLLEEDQV